MRNPDWVRDEVILAMDLYFRGGRKQLPATRPEVIALSALLNRLPVHDLASRTATFRNPAGISMILGNFLGIDPMHETPGLSRNNHLQEEVWAHFAGAPDELRRVATAISEAAGDSSPELEIVGTEIEEEFVEGALLTRMHLSRERSVEAVRRKKTRVLEETGRLACEACGFDFRATYGELGDGFAECHHILPLAELPTDRTTRLSDLAVVCANCHRMLHRGRPRTTLDGLRDLLRLKKS